MAFSKVSDTEMKEIKEVEVMFNIKNVMAQLKAVERQIEFLEDRAIKLNLLIAEMAKLDILPEEE